MIIHSFLNLLYFRILFANTFLRYHFKYYSLTYVFQEKKKIFYSEESGNVDSQNNGVLVVQIIFIVEENAQQKLQLGAFEKRLIRD